MGVNFVGQKVCFCDIHRRIFKILCVNVYLNSEARPRDNTCVVADLSLPPPPPPPSLEERRKNIYSIQ